MSSAGHEALEKFWKTPELVEMLLPFLNAKNTLNLARTRLFNIQILQGFLVWNKLIRRTVSRKLPCIGVLAKPDLAPFIPILKMMKDHKPSLLDLLNLLCKRYPSRPPELSEEVTLRCCSSDQTKLVSPLGFMLLEVVEVAFGSTEQCIERIHIDQLANSFTLEGRWLSSLSARVARQQEEVKLVEMQSIEVGFSKETVDDFVTLVEHCQSMKIKILRVTWSHLEDWPKLSRTLSSTKVSLFRFNPSKDAILGACGESSAPADRDDLRAIWDTTEDHWKVYTFINDDRYGSTYFYKEMGDADWKRLEQLLDMSDKEMEVRCDEWLTHEELDYFEGDSTEAGEDNEDDEDEGAEEEDEDEGAQEDGEGEVDD